LALRPRAGSHSIRVCTTSPAQDGGGVQAKEHQGQQGDRSGHQGTGVTAGTDHQAGKKRAQEGQGRDQGKGHAGAFLVVAAF
jgi:hypothetical protein